ncbi:MAG TPA: hypothetical protein VLE93_03310 [Candidatus Saccharimonadales bacterium]|nr:hypothetical protein [Candidatus Saccharimonadales bacterium]
MLSFLRRTPSVIVFWVISAVATAVIWNSLPSLGAQIGLILFFGVIVLATLNKFMELPLVATVFFSILLVNDWLVGSRVSPIFGTFIIVAILPTIGLLSEIIGYEELQIRRAHWALLGLLVAEANSLFYYWPVSFFNRTLLTGVVFYALWQLLRINEERAHLSYLAHFAFVALAVILVVGFILWANFPQLTVF